VGELSTVENSLSSPPLSASPTLSPVLCRQGGACQHSLGLARKSEAGTQALTCFHTGGIVNTTSSDTRQVFLPELLRTLLAPEGVTDGWDKV
jgi:hypothetical protein